MRLLGRLGRNATWRAAGIACDLARVAITMPIIARRLGGDHYGRWSVAGTAVAVFMACVVTGFHDAVAREHALAPGAERALLRAATRTRVALAAAATPLIIAVVAATADRAAALAAAVMCVGLFAEALATRQILLTVHLEEHRRLPVRAALALVSIGATALVAAAGGGLAAFAALTAAQVAIAAAAGVRVARPLVRAGADTSPLRGPLWRAAWPTVLVCSLEVLHLQIDVLVVSATVGADAAGVLGAGVRIAYLPLLFLGAVTASALPELARMGPAAARTRAHALARRTALAGAAVPLALAAGAPLVVGLLGPDYTALRWLLPALGLRVAIAAYSGPLGTCALACGHQRGNLVVSVAIVLAETALLAAVTPRWGLAGAAAVVVLVELPKAALLQLLIADRPSLSPEASPCTSPR